MEKRNRRCKNCGHLIRYFNLQDTKKWLHISINRYKEMKTGGECLVIGCGCKKAEPKGSH
ncbi:hypothetical protein LCGC14_0374150 [marine sediment metagenome]|uniref:Uncharacterized protein n=1 Tax=marine sediment metagenome TaxID=412755 RepID=A0A0F9T439_9ZZZZ